MVSQLIEKSIVVPASPSRIHAALTQGDYRHQMVPAVPMARESGSGWPRLYVWLATGPTVREIELYVAEPVAGAVVVESSWAHGIERRYALQAIDDGLRTRVTSRLALRLAGHDDALARPLRSLQASELIGLAALARGFPAVTPSPGDRHAPSELWARRDAVRWPDVPVAASLLR